MSRTRASAKAAGTRFESQIAAYLAEHVDDRIAQLVVQPVTRVVFDVVDELPDSTRGAGGFGSTGRA